MWIQLASDAYNSCMVSVVWDQKWIHGFGYVLIFLFFVRTSNDKLYLSDKSATIVADRTSWPLVSYLFNGICVCNCYYNVTLSFWLFEKALASLFTSSYISQLRSYESHVYIATQRKNTFNINWLQAISCRSYSFLKCLFLYSIPFFRLPK